jgi:predicted MFS family arabinose efflux permease
VSEIEPEQHSHSDDELAQQSSGLVGPKGDRIPRTFTAFRHRNYQLFFSGQLISLTGTWLQQVAQSWLVLELVSRSRAELVMGLVSAVSAAPILLFSFYAGIVVDRLNKRNLIVGMQVVMMILAFVLAALTHSRTITVVQIAITGFLLGAANAFDAPARQSFVVDMVGKEDLPNAIALNSAMFNGARILGPSVAGIVISVIGLAGAFFLNGLSFIAVIICLMMMRVNRNVPKSHGSAWLEFKEGLRFIRSQPTIMALLTLIGMVSLFATPYQVLMPVLAKYNLGQSAKGLGYLFTGLGVGALVGALTLSSFGDIKRKGRLLLVGSLTFCAALVALSSAGNMYVAISALFFAGWGFIIQTALINTLIQMSVPDELRGRVISVYTFMFMGMVPIGSLEAGIVANQLGVSMTIRLGAIITAAVALILSPKFIRASSNGSSE